MKTKVIHKLSFKLIVSISVFLFIILAVHTYITVANLEKHLTDSAYQSAYNLSDVIKRSTRYSMLLNRREDVHQIINTIGTESGMEGIRIYNKQGMIIYSTDSSEVYTKVDLNAEACYGCHNSSVPLKQLSTQNKMRFFKNQYNERILGLINPIENEPDCSTAGCHAHSPDTDILGVLDVMLSMKKLDELITANTRTTIYNAVLITALIAFFCGLFIAIMVNKPLKKLLNGIQELSRGNLKYKINVNSKSELGKMAIKFNEMSKELDKAYEEIKDWSENLNKKVHEKSEELKSIYNQVIQIEKLASLGKLSATVAHELNNPLEGILTYSKLISRKLKSVEKNGEYQKLIEHLDLISAESARCGKIVKDLLLFSHKGEDIIETENIISILDQSIMLIQHHLELNGIALIKEHYSDSIKLKCNPQKLQQAFMALLINAIEAMPGGGKIVVKVTCMNETIEIRIIDEGIGISPKDLPHIFEPFYTTKEAAKGTGLGLAVTYGIVTNHNGNIFVEKTSSKGTTFLIILPLN